MKISGSTEFKQFIILLFSFIIAIILFTLLFFTQSVVLIIIVICTLIGLLYLNYKLSGLYNIIIENENIIIENLYIKKIFSSSDFDSVSTTGISLLMPVFPSSPPFFYLKLHNGDKFMFETIKNKFKNHLISVNGEKIAIELTNEIKIFIKSGF